MQTNLEWQFLQKVGDFFLPPQLLYFYLISFLLNLPKNLNVLLLYHKAIFFEVQKGSSVDTQCYVMADQQHAVIMFRGSDNMKDWLANFSAVTDAGPLTKTRAHEGFYIQ